MDTTAIALVSSYNWRFLVMRQRGCLYGDTHSQPLADLIYTNDDLFEAVLPTVGQ